MSTVLSKAEILAADDLRMELVDVPEWGGSVYVRGMTGSERSQYQEHMLRTDADGKRIISLEDADVYLAALTMVDERGVRLFGVADVKELGAKSAQAIARVTEVGQRLSALGREELDELVGNSDDLPSDDSFSPSPEN